MNDLMNRDTNVSMYDLMNRDTTVSISRIRTLRNVLMIYPGSEDCCMLRM